MSENAPVYDKNNKNKNSEAPFSEKHEPDSHDANEHDPENSLSTSVTVKPTKWSKIQNTIMLVAALMISAGQWNDTKDIISSIYETIVENFTHTIQYDLLEQIHIGNSINYVKTYVGEPNVIKRSKINENVIFQYYDDEKYNLTLISSDGRLVGYSVFTQQDGFAPSIPFSETLGSLNIEQAHERPGQYNYDIGNLFYYVESQDLGKEAMFLTLVRGYVEYGSNASEIKNSENYTNEIHRLLESLDHKETFSDNASELTGAINNVRKAIQPNFYAITELNNAIIAEALLTRYEYKAFNKS